MTIKEIPLTANNQKFSILLGKNIYKLRLIYRTKAWFLDIFNSDDQSLILGLPLRQGINILEQHQHLINGSLYVLNQNIDETHAFSELGSKIRLFWEAA